VRNCPKIARRAASRGARDCATVRGPVGNFARTSRRHDYAVDPPKPMLLDVLEERGVPVFGIGKIHDIYNGRGGARLRHHEEQRRWHGKIDRSPPRTKKGLIFGNLVDFDMLYGHVKTWRAFANRWRSFDGLLRPPAAACSHGLAHDYRRSRLRPRSALGNTDHSASTRQSWRTHSRTGRREPGIRETLADMGQTSLRISARHSPRNELSPRSDGVANRRGSRKEP